MVLVDSSVWIEAGRRDGSLEYKVGLENLLEAYEAAWAGPIKLEVLGGARLQERKRLAEFFSIIPYKPIPDSAWDFAVQSYQKIRDSGHTLPINDVLIASLSITWGCRVYAKDHHFDVMEKVLGIRLYRPDYGGKYRPDTGG